MKTKGEQALIGFGQRLITQNSGRRMLIGSYSRQHMVTGIWVNSLVATQTNVAQSPTEPQRTVAPKPRTRSIWPRAMCCHQRMTEQLLEV